MWNHDDDQGIGVLAAIEQAGRKEFFMVGGAGSRERDGPHQGRRHGAEGDGHLPADRWRPRRSSLARLVAQGKGMGDLVEQQVPTLIALQSATITKDNVDKYLPLGFKS